MSANEWANLIADLHKKQSEKVEKGFLPRTAWQKEWNLEISETNKRIRRLLDAGIMETKKFRIPVGQKTYPTPHYKITK